MEGSSRFSEQSTATKVALITGGATVAAALIAAIVTVIVAWGTPTPGPVTPAPPTVFARIQNTGGVGVFAYSGPSTRTARTRGPQEGDLVAVICQERGGEPQTDTNDPQVDQPAGWPVWDKMSDGRWIPDLWTDLPKTLGATPPEGLSAC